MRGHWRRFFVQIGFLAVGGVIEAVSQDLFVTLTAIMLVALPTACWVVFGMLLWTEHQAPDIQSLREKVDDALTLALASTVAALISALTLARLFHIIDILIGPIITVGLGYIAVAISIPAIGFLRTWRDIYLPMVRRRRDAADLVVSDAVHESGMAAMEAHLSAQIAENTVISQGARDDAREAARAANTVNDKLEHQGREILAGQVEQAERDAKAGARPTET